MPSLFTRHKASKPGDKPQISPPQDGTTPPFEFPANSNANHNRRRSSLANPDSSGMLSSLKAKFNSSRVNLATGGEEDTVDPGERRNSLRRFSISQKPHTSGMAGDDGRRASIAASSPSPVFVRDPKVIKSMGLGSSEVESRRRSMDLLAGDGLGDSSGGTMEVGWKPLVPDQKGLSTSVSPVSPTGPNVKSLPSIDTEGSKNVASSPPAGLPKPRLAPGKINIPPPPGLISRQSTNARGMGMGVTIVPSTPLPRPIANLPTLNGPSTPGPRANGNGNGNGNGEAAYGFPATINGNGNGSRPGNERMSSSVNSPAATSSTARWVKGTMPVMLREPSHRPAPPVPTSHEHEHDVEDGSDSDDSASSESESGSDDSADSEGEQHQASPGRLGGVDQRGLLGRRARSESITEEAEEETFARPHLELSIPNRRQVALPSLGSLPNTSPSGTGTPQMSTRSTNASTWALPTPSTPGAQFFSGPGLAWTSFGTSTPTAGTPIGSPLRTPAAGRPAMGAFALPNGVAKAAAIARGETPMAKANPRQASYFDTVGSGDADGSKTPRQGLVESDTVEDVATDEVLDGMRTPRAEHNESPSRTDMSSIGLAAPLAISSLPGMMPAAEEVEVPTNPSLPSTPQPSSPVVESRPTPLSRAPSRPGLNKRMSRSMVDLASMATTWEDRQSRPPSPQKVQTTSQTTTESEQPRTPSATSAIPSRTSSPAPSINARSSADWARPPPTPGIGMTQPFKFFPQSPAASSSPRQVIKNRQTQDLRGSPLRRRRSMDDDKKVKPPQYEPPQPNSGIPGPREEEGREQLPNYWCHVHIEGYLPRKMEFSSPGVQARDRGWKRLYFVLHGTSLRAFKLDIHKFPIKELGPGGLEDVNEADAINLHVHRPGERRESVSSQNRPSAATGAAGRRGSIGDGSVISAGRRGSVTSDTDAITPAGRRSSASSSTVSIATTSSEKEMSLFQPVSQPGARRASVSVPPPAPSSGTNARENISAHLPFGGGNSLVKQYTMQNAESGLAADYIKKKNVVRVRAEGEQFLLQTDGAKDVVDWIEAFQAATNVSLELDTRPMPKIITLPRRRRRRRAGEAAAAAQPGVGGTDDTPEGNARAVEQAERAAATVAARESNSSAVDAMEAMLAEDQAADS